MSHMFARLSLHDSRCTLGIKTVRYETEFETVAWLNGDSSAFQQPCAQVIVLLVFGPCQLWGMGTSLSVLLSHTDFALLTAHVFTPWLLAQFGTGTEQSLLPPGPTTPSPEQVTLTLRGAHLHTRLTHQQSGMCSSTPGLCNWCHILLCSLCH